MHPQVRRFLPIGAIFVIVALAPQAADAYAILVGGVASGSARTYHIVTGQFPASMETSIDEAEDQWSAGGAGTDKIRGGDWHFNRGSDVSSGYAKWNARSEIWDRVPTWFASEGYPAGTLATTPRNALECDIIFVEEVTDPSDPDYNGNFVVDWVDDAPSNLSGTQASERFVTIHEFGHCFGLAHDSDAPNTMHQSYPGAGDFGVGIHRVGEDESEAIRDYKSDSSTGHNLALSRFGLSGAGNPIELWIPSSSGTWSASEGTCGVGIQAVALHHMGTSTLSSVETRWTLSSDTTCFDGDDIVAATDVHSSISSDEVYMDAPEDFCVPSGTTAGSYYLCARVDPLFEVSEVSESDNTIRSERLFTVL